MDALPANLPLPTAAQLAATNARLGMVEPRPGYVIHRNALTAHRRDLAASGQYRGPYYRNRRIVLAAFPAGVEELDA